VTYHQDRLLRMGSENVFISVGTIVLILLIVLVVMLVRRG